MEVTLEKRGKVAILNKKGSLDTKTSASLEEKLVEMIDNNESCIMIDFTELDFISSSGLRMLLMAGKKLKSSKGTMVLCSLQDHVQGVFDVAGFSMIFSIHQSYEQALEEFK